LLHDSHQGGQATLRLTGACDLFCETEGAV